MKPVISQKYPIKVHVWVAISVSGVIGPYFFHRAGRNITVNQYIYQECVKWFIDQLKERRKFSRAILIQDGATPHTALSTRSFLTSNFGNRLIGKHFAFEWPPQSPDLTPADYYLWPTLKRLVYHSPEPYRSLLGLKRAIIFHMRKMARWNHDHLLESVKRRWEWCVRVHGAKLHKEVNGYMSWRSLLCKILFLTHFKQCFTRLLSGQLLSAIQYIHYTYIIHTLYIHYTYIIYTLYIHYTYIIQYTYIIHTLYILTIDHLWICYYPFILLPQETEDSHSRSQRRDVVVQPTWLEASSRGGGLGGCWSREAFVVEVYVQWTCWLLTMSNW